MQRIGSGLAAAVGLDAAATWPAFTSRMPWASFVEEYASNGQQVTLVDNRSKIALELAAWNGPLGWPAPVPTFDPNECAGGSGSGTGGTGTGTGTGGGNFTAAGGACSLGSNGTPASLVALGLLGFTAVLRRARRSRAPRGIL